MKAAEGAPEVVVDADEWMSQHLDDQSSIVGYPHASQDLLTNEGRDRIHFSDFY